jgi:hypothetical protein
MYLHYSYSYSITCTYSYGITCTYSYGITCTYSYGITCTFKAVGLTESLSSEWPLQSGRFVGFVVRSLASTPAVQSSLFRYVFCLVYRENQKSC